MLNKIIEIIREELSIDSSQEITEGTVLREDLEADSLNLVEVVMSLEDEFGVELSEDELDTIITVGDLEKYISNRID